MRLNQNHRSFFWGVSSQVSSIVYGLLALPIISRSISSEEMSAWMVFSNIMFFVLVMDSSFSSNLARNFTFVLSGAKEILKEGYNPENSLGTIVNRKLLGDLFYASKEIYSKNLFYLWILISILSIWFVSVTYNQHILWSLLIFLASLLIILVFSYSNVVLLGYNRVEDHLKAQTSFRLILSLTGVVAAYYFESILALSASFLISCVLYRVITFLFTRSIINEIKSTMPQKDLQAIKEVKSKIYHNSIITLKIAISAFSITRLNVFIASYFLPYSVSASFSLTLQALSSIMSLSQLPIIVQLPLLSSMALKKDFFKIRYKVIKCALISASIFIFVFISFYFFGNYLLEVLGSKTSFIGGGALLLWGLSFLLETNHSVFSNYITSLNKIPFLKSAILSGIAIPVLSLLLLSVVKLDASVLIFSQFVVQLSYNNWKWPFFAINDLNTKIEESI